MMRCALPSQVRLDCLEPARIPSGKSFALSSNGRLPIGSTRTESPVAQTSRPASAPETRGTITNEAARMAARHVRCIAFFLEDRSIHHGPDRLRFEPASPALALVLD